MLSPAEGEAVPPGPTEVRGYAFAGGERRYGWAAFAVRHEPGWTVVRSLKRALDVAGPETAIAIGSWRLSLLDLTSGFFSALHRELVERSNAGLTADETLHAAVSVPANATCMKCFANSQAGCCIR